MATSAWCITSIAEWQRRAFTVHGRMQREVPVFAVCQVPPHQVVLQVLSDSLPSGKPYRITCGRARLPCALRSQHVPDSSKSYICSIKN